MMMLIEFLFGNQHPLIDSDLSPQTSTQPFLYHSFCFLRQRPSELNSDGTWKFFEKVSIAAVFFFQSHKLGSYICSSHHVGYIRSYFWREHYLTSGEIKSMSVERSWCQILGEFFSSTILKWWSKNNSKPIRHPQEFSLRNEPLLHSGSLLFQISFSGCCPTLCYLLHYAIPILI